jgi:hypothetical protein
MKRFSTPTVNLMRLLFQAEQVDAWKSYALFATKVLEEKPLKIEKVILFILSIYFMKFSLYHNQFFVL